MEEKKLIDWAELQRPIVLEGRDWEKNNYLLMDELNKAYEKVKTFQNLHEKQSEDSEFSVPMNIGIVGDRGTGKTSLLKSFKNKLTHENYYVFDIVDPNLLSSDMNILEILISNIYREVTNTKLDDMYFSQEIIIRLKSIMTVLSIQRQGAAYFKKDNPSIDILDKINDVVNLHSIIDKLLLDFKKVLKKKNSKEYKDLVLIVDDLDLLENSHIFKFLNQIQEHLNTKIIIIFAYREEQLENSLFEKKIEENEELLKYEKVDNDEIDQQIQNILLKLIPTGNRIKLRTQNELLKIDYKKIFNSIDIDEKEMRKNNLIIKDYVNYPAEITVEDWIYETISSNTKLYIKPIDERESVVLFLPKSLREFIQFAELVSSFDILEYKEEDKKDKEKKKRYYESLSKNINKFKVFFINRVNNQIGINEAELIESWNYATSYQKNYLSFHYFASKTKEDYYKLNSENKNKEYPFNLELVQNYNLRLGDIYEIMELYKGYSASTVKDFFLVYWMKTLYSIELLDLLTLSLIEEIDKDQAKDNNEDSNGEKEKDNHNLISYLELINTSFMPENFNYFEYTTDRNDNDYIFELPSEVLSDKENRSFINGFLNTVVSVQSDIRKGAYLNNTSFRYRKLYSYDLLNYDTVSLGPDFSRQAKYNIEYYVPIGQKNYVARSLEDIIKDKNGVGFIFYSMFQIDNFIRLTYARRSNDEEYEKYTKAISSINALFKYINGDRIHPNTKKILDENIRRNYFVHLSWRENKLLSPYEALERPEEKIEIESKKDMYDLLFEKLSKVDDNKKLNAAGMNALSNFIRKLQDNKKINTTYLKKLSDLVLNLYKNEVINNTDLKKSSNLLSNLYDENKTNNADLKELYDFLDSLDYKKKVNNIDFEELYSLLSKLDDNKKKTNTKYEYKIKKDGKIHDINFMKNNRNNKNEFRSTIKKVKKAFNDNNEVQNIIKGIEDKFLNKKRINNINMYIPNEIEQLNKILSEYRIGE